MVDHHQPRFEIAHSKRITHTKQSFRLSTSEFSEFLSFHRRLNGVLYSIRSKTTADIESANPYIWQGIRRSAPDLIQEARLHSILQTEIVMRPDRSFALVSMDAHSSRNLEALMSISRMDPATLTSSQRLMDGIRTRVQGNEVIFLTHRDGMPRRQELAQIFHRHGIRVVHLSLEDALEHSRRVWPFILEMPLMQSGKSVMKALYDRATFIIEPFSQLSSQFVLALLSRPIGIGSFADEYIQSHLAKTYTMLSPRIPDDAVVKQAHPFSGQRVIGSYRSFYAKMESMSFAVDRYVAQERIESVQVLHEGAHCPIRLVFVSLKGEILTGMAIARVPANGKPAHDVVMDIVIR